MMSLINLAIRTILCILFVLLNISANAAAPVYIPLQSDSWIVKNEVKFSTLEGFPMGLMEGKGSAVLKDFSFKNGTIEFDILLNAGISTFIFRRNTEEGEALVFRPQPNCAASNDCFQYTPITHGAFLWDLFPQYQTQAPLAEKAWNHVKLVVLGRRMNVYLNGLPKPALSIKHLEGSLLDGTIRLSGPASWANLVITVDSTEDIPATEEPDSTAADTRFVRNWMLSPALTMKTSPTENDQTPITEAPDYSSISTFPDSNWRKIKSEYGGLVNLSRKIGSTKDATITGAWLRSIVVSDIVQEKTVSIAWVREIWIYVNGKLIYSDKNPYGTAEQKSPYGRAGLENGSFKIHLEKGENRIEVLLDDNFGGSQHFGWGMKIRFDDTKSIHFLDYP